MPLESEDFVRFKILRKPRRRRLSYQWKKLKRTTFSNDNDENQLLHGDTQDEELSQSSDSDSDDDSQSSFGNQDEWIEYRNFGLDDIDQQYTYLCNK